MTGIRLLNLLAVSSLAIMACSFGATPVNALSSDLHHVSRHMARGHDALAMRKRSSRSGSKRCKPRPSSLAPAEPKATPKSDPPQKSGNKGGAPSGPPPASHGNTGGKFGLAWANGDGPDLAKYKTGKYSPSVGCLSVIYFPRLNILQYLHVEPFLSLQREIAGLQLHPDALGSEANR
jgi:hypothetical protein